jgi:hypothetical protein
MSPLKKGGESSSQKVKVNEDREASRYGDGHQRWPVVAILAKLKGEQAAMRPPTPLAASEPALNSTRRNTSRRLRCVSIRP